MTMRFAGIFEGIGGFSLAFTRAGWTPTVHIEKNPHRQKVLARHWPDVPRGDDVRDATGADLGDPDVAVAGFPCQGVSIAAPHRDGLRDNRSNLFWEFPRLVGEVQRLIGESRPRWCILENTPGLLTSGPKRDRGADLEAVLRALVELGYGVGYRVVDANGVNSAQRRQRIIVVAHRSGDPRIAWRVLGDDGGSSSGPGGHDGAGRPGAQRSSLVGPAGDDDDLLIWRKSRNPRTGKNPKPGVIRDYSTWVPATHSNTLANSEGGAGDVYRQRHLILQNGRLRVLTPIEWERLQGFPDDWTAGLTDGQRFQALGDAMNVDMGTWLARRLAAVDAAIPLIGAP